MSINQRLREFYSSKKISHQNIEDWNFTSRVTSNKYVKDGYSIPSDFILKLKSKFPELNINWLFTGEGEMAQDEFEETKLDEFESRLKAVEEIISLKLKEEEEEQRQK